MIDKFLESVVEAEKSKEKKACRGPFLAQFELAKLSSQECIYSDSIQSKLIFINVFVLFLFYPIEICQCCQFCDLAVLFDIQGYCLQINISQAFAKLLKYIIHVHVNIF